LAECHIKKIKPVIPKDIEADTLKKARAAYASYRTWQRTSRVKIVESEVLLVSETHQFGGQIDAIGLLKGEYCLIDFKTSNGTYADHLIQLAAYRALWEENHPDKLLTGGFHLLRFGKNEGDFHQHFYQQLDRGWIAFSALLELHRQKKPLAKLAH
jgi:hypothetical protein